MSTEVDRLFSGPDAGELPEGVGMGRMDFIAPDEAKSVLDGARQVWLSMAGLDHADYAAGSARSALPEWFRRACEDRPAGSDRIWDLTAWLAWADPAERAWRWWDANVMDESYGWVRIVLHEWPCAVGVLAATLHACGATEVGYDG